MSGRRTNPYRVKANRSYSVQELAARCGVHKNTVRHWQAIGLAPIDHSRPALFQGETVRAFLVKRNASRKRPCQPGTLYCFRCREPRSPALGMVDYVPITPASGNLRAICEHCGAMIHRRARWADLSRIMPGCTIQFAQGPQRLSCF
ncbi:MAG: helix-turn-helix domain-containing protein [Rhizomicrobium sp.]